MGAVQCHLSFFVDLLYITISIFLDISHQICWSNFGTPCHLIASRLHVENLNILKVICQERLIFPFLVMISLDEFIHLFQAF